jgi:hypothetical protein
VKIEQESEIFLGSFRWIVRPVHAQVSVLR